MDRFRSRRRRKISLFSGDICQFGYLFFYKYYEFAGFVDIRFFLSPKYRNRCTSMERAIAVGISFYIFQAVGYAVDVYRGTIKAEKIL